MSILIRQNETFDIKVRYIESGTGLTFFAVGEEAPGVQEETFTFKKIPWGDTVRIMNACMIPCDGTLAVNVFLLKDAKLKLLMVGWTLKEDGVAVEVTPDNIDRLHPALGDYLTNKLDESLTMTEAKAQPTTQ